MAESIKSIESEAFQAEVRESLEERMARTKKVSRRLLKEQRELLPKSVFTNEIIQAQKELDKGLAFLDEAELEPKKVFTDLKDAFRSKRGMVYTVMNNWKNPNEPIKGHDFQRYLSHLADRHFQSWLKSKGIEEPFQIGARNPNQFPSIFVVYHEDIELIQFSLLDQWYGVRDRRLSEMELVEEHHDRISNIDDQIETEQSRMEELQRIKEDPIKSLDYVGLKAYYVWLFMNKKRFFANLDKQQTWCEIGLKNLREERETEIQYFEYRFEREKMKKALVDQVEPFFKEFAYELKEKRSSLY